MLEDFIHFIWQYQYFRKDSLETTSQETVNILNPGFHNLMSGPDFSEARIEIGDLTWTGHVEIHVKASSWDSHHHDRDPAYNNVILHVVWNADKDILREDGTSPPTIELKERVDPSLLERYQALISNTRDILCYNQLTEVEYIVKIGMIEKALIGRLEKKASQVLEILKRNANDWEETAYQLLAKGFGFKSNSNAFFELSRVLPLKIVYKHADNLFQLEAMFFGQAGLLTGRSKDAHHGQLKDEFKFLKGKHKLPNNMLNKSVWKMGRLRPANFPTVRISQLAAALVNLKHVFSTLMDAETLQKLRFVLRAEPYEYWASHFVFGEIQSRKSARIGIESTDRLIMNVVVPLLAAYSIFSDDQRYMDRAVTILQQLKAEKNAIIKRWEDVNVNASSAADTQGLIELYNSFCLHKNCLSCNIGTSILKQHSG